MTLALETFKWEGTQLETRYCFELKIPAYLRKEGISKIKIQANFYKVYFYSNGWFNSESPEVNYEETRKLVVVHDVVHLLDYDSKPCIEDSNYSNNICRRDFIYKLGHYRGRVKIIRTSILLHSSQKITPRVTTQAKGQND